MSNASKLTAIELLKNTFENNTIEVTTMTKVAASISHVEYIHPTIEKAGYDLLFNVKLSKYIKNLLLLILLINICVYLFL